MQSGTSGTRKSSDSLQLGTCGRGNQYPMLMDVVRLDDY